MYCKHCGKEIDDDAQFCASCGNKVNSKSSSSVPNHYESESKNKDISTITLFGDKSNGYCCPECGSRDLQVINETSTHTTGSDFSAGKGCLGYLLFGPLGILCGSCGQSQKVTTTNTNYFICKKCGQKFRNPNDLKQEAESTKSISNFCIAFGFIACIVMFIIYFASGMNRNHSSTGFMVIFCIVLPLVLVISGLALKSMGSNKEGEAQLIISKMEKHQKDHNQSSSVLGSISPIHEEKPTNASWICDNCKTVNSGIVKKCINCGTHISAQSNITHHQNRNDTPSSNEWLCPKCGRINQNYVGTCGCGTEKPM